MPYGIVSCGTGVYFLSRSTFVGKFSNPPYDFVPQFYLTYFRAGYPGSSRTPLRSLALFSAPLASEDIHMCEYNISSFYCKWIGQWANVTAVNCRTLVHWWAIALRMLQLRVHMMTANSVDLWLGMSTLLALVYIPCCQPLAPPRRTHASRVSLTLLIAAVRCRRCIRHPPNPSALPLIQRDWDIHTTTATVGKYARRNI